MSDRRIVPTFAVLKSVEMFPEPDLNAWLSTYPTTVLLAHSDEGVIWGRIAADGQAVMRSATVSQPDQIDQWQQVRLFNPQYEVHCWRNGDGRWQGRCISEVETAENAIAVFSDALDEPHLLWGNKAEPDVAGFTRLYDSSQGLTHILPRDYDKVSEWLTRKQSPVRLWIRHYLHESGSTGVLRIAVSRIYGFKRPEAEAAAQEETSS